MKKTIVLIVTGGVVIIMLSAIFLLVHRIDTRYASEVVKIEKDYVKIRERVEKQQKKGIEVDFADDYILLFTQISEGHVEDAKDYAQLVRRITQGTIAFEDEEVFGVAKDLTQVFKKMADGFDDFGIQQIRIVNDAGESLLVIDYFDIKGYSIRKMDKEEKLYSGEQLIEDDGLLGENRIEIMFYGAKVSNELANIYPLGIVHELKGVQTELESSFNIMIGYPIPGFSGFVVHIGTNEPLNIKEQDFTSIDRPIGIIEIAV
ncbi:MAG: hypothetical protein FWG40_10300 [Peptococcaceae bacterium]|nr:hypothetical protein [Peptococcaceae bacterium]